MTYKQIEASREVRLWIGQVIVPLGALVIMTSPAARTTIKSCFYKAKRSVSNKFKRGEA